MAVFLSWLVAALLVLGADAVVDPRSATAGIIVKIAAILLVSFVHMRTAVREATLDRALIIGASWLAMDIGAELTATRLLGHGWFGLIGPPSVPLLRQLLLIVWILAPALFARDVAHPAA